MLADNPLLTLLGRRGRGAVAEALLRAPGRTWTVRDLARAADVPSVVASRAVRELSALGAVAFLRPGRDAQVRFLPGSPAGKFLDAVRPPDLRQGTARAFADAYGNVAGVLRLIRYTEPGEDPADPRHPVRIAVVVRRDEEAALEAAGPALDAVRAQGWPAPRVATFTPGALRQGNTAALAVLAGTTL